jgi:hypothetical protein
MSFKITTKCDSCGEVPTIWRIPTLSSDGYDGQFKYVAAHICYRGKGVLVSEPERTVRLALKSFRKHKGNEP